MFSCIIAQRCFKKEATQQTLPWPQLRRYKFCSHTTPVLAATVSASSTRRRPRASAASMAGKTKATLQKGKKMNYSKLINLEETGAWTKNKNVQACSIHEASIPAVRLYRLFQAPGRNSLSLSPSVNFFFLFFTRQ